MKCGELGCEGSVTELRAADLRSAPRGLQVASGCPQGPPGASRSRAPAPSWRVRTVRLRGEQFPAWRCPDRTPDILTPGPEAVASRAAGGRLILGQQRWQGLWVELCPLRGPDMEEPLQTQ